MEIDAKQRKPYCRSMAVRGRTITLIDVDRSRRDSPIATARWLKSSLSVSKEIIYMYLVKGLFNVACENGTLLKVNQKSFCGIN